MAAPVWHGDHTDAPYGDTGTTKVLTFAGTPADDELIVFAFYSSNGGTVPDWSTVGATEFANGSDPDGAPGPKLRLAYRVAASESGATYTLNPTAGNFDNEDHFAGFIVTGVDTANPIGTTLGPSFVSSESGAAGIAPPLPLDETDVMTIQIIAKDASAANPTTGSGTFVDLGGSLRCRLMYEAFTGLTNWDDQESVQLGGSTGDGMTGAFIIRGSTAAQVGPTKAATVTKFYPSETESDNTNLSSITGWSNVNTISSGVPQYDDAHSDHAARGGVDVTNTGENFAVQSTAVTSDNHWVEFAAFLDNPPGDAAQLSMGALLRMQNGSPTVEADLDGYRVRVRRYIISAGPVSHYYLGIYRVTDGSTTLLAQSANLGSAYETYDGREKPIPVIAWIEGGVIKARALDTEVSHDTRSDAIRYNNGTNVGGYWFRGSSGTFQQPFIEWMRWGDYDHEASNPADDWHGVPWDHSWVATDAQEADTSLPEEGETVTKVVNRGLGVNDDLDTLVSDTPVMRLDHFSTGYHGIEFGADEGIKVEPVGRTIDSTNGLTIAILFEIGSTTPSGFQPIMWCSDFSDGNPSRHVLFVDGTVLKRRTGQTGDDSCVGDAATLAIDTPYLAVAYWDPTTAANSYVLLDNVDVSPTTGKTSTGHTALDQFSMSWYVNGHDDLTIHSLGVYEGELTTQQRADLESYRALIAGGGGVSATAAGAWSWTATGSAAKSVDATSAVTWNWTATASTVKSVDATSAATWNWTATASTVKSVDATSAGSWSSWTATVTSTKSVPTVAADTWAWTATVTSTKSVPTVAADTWVWTATTVTLRSVAATASNAWNWNATATATVSGAWGAPQNVVATSTGTTTIQVTWDSVPGATGYDIERNGSIIAFDHVASPFNDAGLIPSTLYTYRVRAVAPA